jgi:exonuclease VII small subunit
MKLAEHKNRIENKFVSYEALQTRHLKLMKGQRLSDIKALVVERETASINLQSALNAFMENAGSFGKEGMKLLNEFETRLSRIMSLDESIAAELERHKKELRKELGQMKNGKRAIQGYGSAAQIAKKNPRVFSFNR